MSLSNELKQQIEQEIKSGQHTHPGTDYGHGFNKGYDSGYRFAVERYVTRAITAEQEVERLKTEFRKAIDDFRESTLKVIEAKELAEKERDELNTKLDKAKDISIDLYKVQKEVERLRKALENISGFSPYSSLTHQQIVEEMKSIASDALTRKPITNE